MCFQFLRSSCVFFVVLLFSTSSCSFARSVKGNGNVVGNRTGVEAFSMLRIEGAFDVVLHYTEEAPYVLVTTDNNIQEYVMVKQSNDLVVVKSEGNIRPTELKVDVYTNHYRKLELRGASDLVSTSPLEEDELTLSMYGAGDVKLDIKAMRTSVNVNGSGGAELDVGATYLSMALRGSGDVDAVCRTAELSVDVMGSGDVQLSGKGDNGIINLLGSGDVSAKNLVLARCEAKIRGSGDIKIHVTDAISAAIYGSGSVYCTGAPSKVKSRVFGSGSLHLPDGDSSQTLQRS